VILPATLSDVDEIHYTIGKSAFWIALFKEPPSYPPVYPGALCLYLIPKPPTFHGMQNSEAPDGVRFLEANEDHSETEVALDCDKFLMMKLDPSDPLLVPTIEARMKELCRGIMMLGILMREMQIRIENLELPPIPPGTFDDQGGS
jgi:hypothetical protein